MFKNFSRTTLIACILCLSFLSALSLVSAEVTNEGMALYASGDYNKSIEWFQNALLEANEADRAQLLNNIGVSYLALGQLDLAKEKFDEAIKANSSYPYAWINLGVVNGDAGNTDEAIRCYDKAIELDNSVAATVLIKKGGLLTIAGKYDDALSAFKEAESIAEKEDQSALYTGLGAVYYLQKDNVAAEEAFNHAIELDPANAALPYYNLGVMKIDEKKYDEAKTALEQAISSSPSGNKRASQLLVELDKLIANSTSSNS